MLLILPYSLLGKTGGNVVCTFGFGNFGQSTFVHRLYFNGTPSLPVACQAQDSFSLPKSLQLWSSWWQYCLTVLSFLYVLEKSGLCSPGGQRAVWGREPSLSSHRVSSKSNSGHWDSDNHLDSPAMSPASLLICHANVWQTLTKQVSQAVLSTMRGARSTGSNWHFMVFPNTGLPFWGSILKTCHWSSNR